jgi:nitrogen regulatory protein PII
MKMVVAYIRHEAFEPIRTELLELGFPSLSISEVKGSGRQKGITERYRGAELTNYLRPKVKIECVVSDGDVQTIVDTILKHGRTGAVGDGKVFVLPVEASYRIRTGESGEETLQAHPDAAPPLPISHAHERHEREGGRTPRPAHPTPARRPPRDGRSRARRRGPARGRAAGGAGRGRAGRDRGAAAGGVRRVAGRHGSGGR